MPITRRIFVSPPTSTNYGSNSLVNPLMDTGNYIVPHEQYEVGTLAVDGWAVIFDTAMGGAAARPLPSSLYQM